MVMVMVNEEMVMMMVKEMVMMVVKEMVMMVVKEMVMAYKASETFVVPSTGSMIFLTVAYLNLPAMNTENRAL